MKQICIVAAVLTALVIPANATTLIPATLADLTRDASVIVRGSVVAAEPTWNGDWRSIETLVTIQVESTMKGVPSSSVQFRAPGGRIGRYRRVVVGAASFAVGQHVIVFLGTPRDGVPYVLGLSQGVFRIAGASNAPVITPPSVSGRRAFAVAEFERQVRRIAESGR